MDGPDFLGGLVDHQAEQEENFDNSSLSMTLRQLGAPAGWIRRQQRDTRYDWQWFNDQPYLDAHVGSAKLQKVPLFKLLTRPTKSELYPVWVDHLNRAYQDGCQAAILIYGTAHSGRMICTNIRLSGQSHLHVEVRDLKFNITPFTGFFSGRYGPTVVGDEHGG